MSPARTTTRRANYARTETLGLAVFALYFAVYVTSNASTTFEPSESPAKHLVMIAAAALSLFMVPQQSVRSMLIFAPLSIIYLLGNLPAYALMALVFAAALPLLSRGLQALIDRRRIAIVVLLALISLVPTLLAVVSLEPDVLLSTYYGRPRLLLGYWHPKEAAASLAVPMFLYLMIRGRDVPRLALALLPALLWIVGSRNMALAMCLAIGVRFFPKWTFSIVGVTLAGLAIFLLASSASYDLFDELLSLRFSVWSDALSDSVQLNSTDLFGGDRLAIDSYYVEVFLSSGLAGLLLFVSWAAFFFIQYIRPFQHNTWSRSLFVAILFFAAFDSGIVSTGNVFHVFAWVCIGVPIFKAGARKRRPRRSPEPLTSTPPQMKLA